MSARTKGHRTNQREVYTVVIEMCGKTKKRAFVPAKHFQKLEAFLVKYGESESIPWEDLAKDRIAKYKKSGLALRGARYREGLSQKELAKKTGLSQENISKMENGQRSIGKKVAKKLAKVLRLHVELFKNDN
jgi:DNA-binding XRE family transcriptional regulator